MFVFTALNYTTDVQVLMTGNVRKHTATLHRDQHQRPVAALLAEAP